MKKKLICVHDNWNGEYYIGTIVKETKHKVSIKDRNDRKIYTFDKDEVRIENVIPLPDDFGFKKVYELYHCGDYYQECDSIEECKEVIKRHFNMNCETNGIKFLKDWDVKEIITFNGKRI